MEFPEGVGFTDVWTVPGEEEYARAYRAGGTFDTPLAEIHRHLVPYHAMQIEDFVDAVREGREPAVTGREAVKSLEIVQAIYDSSRTGRSVELTRHPDLPGSITRPDPSFARTAFAITSTAKPYPAMPAPMMTATAAWEAYELCRKDLPPVDVGDVDLDGRQFDGQ